MKLYTQKSHWRSSGSSGSEEYDMIEVYEKLSPEQVSHEFEHDRYYGGRDSGSRYLDMSTGDIYARIRSVDADKWGEIIIRGAATGEDCDEYEELKGCLVQESFLKDNALAIISGMIRQKSAAL